MPYYGTPMYPTSLYNYPYPMPHYFPGYPQFGYPPMPVPPHFSAPTEHIPTAPLASSNSETSSEVPHVAPVANTHFYSGPPSNLYLSPKLAVVTSKGGFQHWIKQFLLVLKDYGLDSLIPDSRGQLSRVPTATEIQSFDSTLLYYVKEEFLPSWFKEATIRSANKFQAIQRAMVLSLQETDQSHLWAELKSLTYNGSTDAFIFISKIRSIIDLFPDSTSTSTVSLLKTIIFDSLTGSYTSIVKKYAQKSSTDYSVEDILNDIQFEYDFSQNHKKHSSSTTTTTSSSTTTTTSSSSSSPRSSTSSRRTHPRRSAVCSYCQRPGHTVTQCYTKQNYEARQKKRAAPQQRSARDRVNNISIENPDVPTDQPVDHHLRPTTTIGHFNSNQHLLLDSGSSITLVNNSNLLHDFTTNYVSPFIATSQNYKLHDEGKGFLKLQFLNGKEISIPAYFVPEITDNILSVAAIRTARHLPQCN